ncbi:MAG: acyl-CoA thioesterase [Verrucomicrobiales bacterium]
MPEAPAIRTEEEVMFFDTDCGGVVHNLAYLRFIETARTRLAARLGLEVVEMAQEGEFPALLRTEIDYRKPARLGDKLCVEGQLESFEGVRFWCGFRILRPADGEVLVESRQQLALIRLPAGRPMRLPAAWAETYPELEAKGGQQSD